MKSKLPEMYILKELEDALEERQDSDRRSMNKGYDPESLTDRRRGDRREQGEEGSLEE